MTQTRTFLILAWLMVATLLWMEWGKERQAALQPAPAVPAAALPMGTPALPVAQVPGAQAQGVVAAPEAQADLVRLRNDVLALQLDGRDIVHAELLKYPQTRAAGSPPVVLFDTAAATHFAARASWRGADGKPLALRPEGPVRDVVLANGAQA
ncbi:MAG: membrane protein insertase YidC, partial [Variovorax sp.]